MRANPEASSVMKKVSWTLCGALVVVGLGSGACGSSNTPAGTGGTPATGGSTGGTPSTGGTLATGGTPSTGGTLATGGSTGGTNLGGLGGEGGDAPSTGGVGTGGTAPVAPACDEIPSLEQGDTALFAVVVGDATEDCLPLPAVNTCEGQPFRSGDSPEIDWNAGPTGTLSYAVVLKDISILSTVDPENYEIYAHGYHWAAWDIPAATTALPANLGAGHEIPGINNARQWATFEYSYFGPCPNFSPDTPEAELVTDSYSFVVYALPTAPPALVPPAVTSELGAVRAMDDYFKSIAIAATEFRVTSNAQSTEFDPGGLGTTVPPCSAAGEDPPDCVNITP